MRNIFSIVTDSDDNLSQPLFKKKNYTLQFYPSNNIFDQIIRLAIYVLPTKLYVYIAIIL